MPAARLCKTPRNIGGETCCDIGKSKTKHACIVEAGESTRIRLEGALSRYHEKDHIAAKGINSLCKYSQWHMCVMYEHERKAHTRRHDSNKHTTRVGALPQSHPGLCGTLVGPSKDTHGTPVPKQGRPWLAHNSFHETTSDKRPPDLKTNVRYNNQVWSYTWTLTHWAMRLGAQVYSNASSIKNTGCEGSSGKEWGNSRKYWHGSGRKSETKKRWSMKQGMTEENFILRLWWISVILRIRSWNFSIKSTQRQGRTSRWHC